MVKSKIKNALVLSGSASRYFAQIGALKAVFDSGFVPDVIAGCSGGALVGVCIAAGKTPEEIRKEFVSKSPFSMVDFSLKKQGLLKGDKIVRAFLNFAKVKTFEDLKIPLRINATDINTGEQVVFSSGDLAKALNASIAFPGMLVPRHEEGRVLVDGGIYGVLPVNLVPEAKRIVAIDVSFYKDNVHNKSSGFHILAQSAYLLQRRVADEELKNMSNGRKVILIRPPVEKYLMFEYKKDHFNQMIKLGYAEAIKAIANKRL